MGKKNRSGYISHMGRRINQVANERGRSVEQRSLAVLNRSLDPTLGPLPDWLKDVRAATPEERRQGKNLVADTDIGKVFVNVTSSRGFADAFDTRRRPTRISAVVAAPLDDPRLRNALVQAFARDRDAILQRRKR